jgi:hypothetical protein
MLGSRAKVYCTVEENGKMAILRIGRTGAFAAMAMLSLSGCQPPEYTVLASKNGSTISFTGSDASNSLLAWGDDGIYAEDFTVYAGQTEIWAIRRMPATGCRSTDDGDPYPVTYGITPRCWVEAIPAQRLRSGVVYRIEADGLRYAIGSFRIDGDRITNL